MSSSAAWQRHGCYHLGSEQYFNMPLEKSLIGCEDDWNSLDHFDPTADNKRVIKHFHHLREQYPSLLDGLNLVQFGNWTHQEQYPGSNSTPTELGLWSAARSPIPVVQNFTGERTTQVWLLYTNENLTQNYEYPCDGGSWISTPFMGGAQIRNLIYPVSLLSFSSISLYTSLDFSFVSHEIEEKTSR